MNANQLTEAPNGVSPSGACTGSPTDPEYYIVDVRKEWRHQPYITFWRPNNCNYAYPLAWAGRYTKATVDAQPWYYCNTNGSAWLKRFPVPCEIVERYGVDPRPGIIDGNVGPVLPNTQKMRRKLRRYAYIPEGAVTTAVRR